MLIYTNQKSPKKFHTNKKVLKKMEQEKEWLESLNSISKSKLVTKKVLVKTKRPNLSFVPPGRETPNYPSMGSSGGVATKPVQGLYYTGDKMKGIGTLHKSNAVPVFTDEEARDQATMRR